jgi:hypothetical protein
VAAVASACGGAAPEPRAPAAQSEKAAAEPEPQTIEQAQAQIERARAQLEGPVATGVGGAAAPPAPPTAEGTASGAGATARGESFAGESGCATACRAIDSMRRAVDALCRMAGEQDARCTDARRTLAGSQARVSACGCTAP